MKHLWKYIAGALAFALPVASCSDDNTSDIPDKEWGELTAVSEEEITLDANQADQEALKFSWTAASVVTRSSSVEYDLYLNIEGEDLFKGIKREWGGEAGLTISFTHEELNDLIITTFGGKSGERFAFRACVYAHTDNYLIEDKTSEEVAFAATAYAAEVVKPASLWMKGGACEYGWDKAIELPQGDAGTYTAENVVLKFGKPADNKGFKFYVEENGSYPFYGQKIDGEFGQIQTFAIANDGDSQFYPLQYDYTSGIYTVHVDLNTMLLTLTRTGDVTEFDPETALYILGDNMENGWDMVEANALLLVGENIYENTNIYLKPESSFKFYFYDWTEYIRDEAAGEYWTLMKKGGDDGDIRFIPGDQGLGEGYYTVRVDLNTLKINLTGGYGGGMGSRQLHSPDENEQRGISSQRCKHRRRHGQSGRQQGQRIQIRGFEQRMEYRIRRQGGFRRPRRTDGLPRLGTCAKQQPVLSPADGIRRRKLPDHGGPYDHDSPV